MESRTVLNSIYFTIFTYVKQNVSFLKTYSTFLKNSVNLKYFKGMFLNIFILCYLVLFSRNYTLTF